jgi:hypothetical protein
MKQGSVEQLVANELKCKWSATLAALAKLPLGVGVDLPSVPVSEAARLRAMLHTSGRTSLFRYTVSTKTGVIRVTKVGVWMGSQMASM